MIHDIIKNVYNMTQKIVFQIASQACRRGNIET